MALFLVILAFLAGRVNAGEDPGLRKSAAAVATPEATSTPDPYTAPTFQVPGDDGSTQPAPAAPDANPPTTRQS